MLQSSALGTTDYQLRIPVRLRHVSILDAAPAIELGSSGQHSVGSKASSPKAP